jgi:hypothetical protein
MKYLVFSLFMTLMVACNYDYHNSISGNGNVVTKEIKTGTFNYLSVSNALDVIIIPSDSQKIVIKADENLLDFIKVRVRDNTLLITAERRIRISRSKKIEVYTRTLEQIEGSAAATIKNSDSLVIDNLKITSSSAAEINICGQFKDLNAEASSASNIKLYGRVANLQANVSSAAGLNAFGMTADKASVVVSSAANAKINVTQEAKFDASSAGSIVYHGDPVVKVINASSGGSVNK